VPRIVLPITSRGLVVTDRLCWAVLGVAMAAAAALIPYQSRGTTFNFDELHWVYDGPDFDAELVLEPYAGSLIATNRLVYQAILETLGTGYLPFRLLGLLAALLVPALFYALVKRRIGALPALAPALVLLLFGSAGEYVITPIGFAPLLSIAAGLGALLALERDDRLGDAAACSLITLSVATFSNGLAFLVGVAVSVLMRSDRWRRAWIVAVPLLLYAAWYLWALDAPDSASEQTKLGNVLLIPNYAAEALAAAVAALSGFDYEFNNPGAVDTEWGRALAVAALATLALRIRGGNVPRSLWVSLAILLTVWVAGALATEGFRGPTAGRYTYIGAVGLLLVVTDAARSVRFSKLGLVALFGACAISVATNAALLRDTAASVRNEYSTPARAQFAIIELARDHLDPESDPGSTAPAAGPFSVFSTGAGRYLAAADRFGSLALPLDELERQDESVRQGADQVLADALELELQPSPSGEAARRCRRVRTRGAGEAIGFELPPGGAKLRARGPAAASLTVGRFASSPSAELGTLPPGKTATLAIPRDSSPKPWQASVTGTGSVEVCALR
jgi:hypothetical protein